MQAKVRRFVLTVSMLVVLCFVSMLVAQAAETKTAPKTSKPNAKITAKQAEKVALKKYPGKIVEKTQLENEEGVWQYAVMIQSGKTLREVMVNAQTGKIDNVEVTTAAKEKDEAANEKTKEKGESDEKEGNEGAESK